MNYELLIAHNNKLYKPDVIDSVTWETELKGVQGKLSFKILADDKVFFTEGDAVRFKVDEDKIFYGFIFTMNSDKDNIISVTAYDQLRYLKNKDTYNFIDKTANDIIKMIADDFLLKTGTLDNTQTKLKLVCDNQTLFDMIQTALDETLSLTGKYYVMYDDFGKITLKSLENMKLNVLIDEESAENFSFTSSIDENTYNQIKLFFEDEKTSSKKVVPSADNQTIKQWGVLQYTDTIKTLQDAEKKADTLLELYNKKTKNLSFKNVFGHNKVRAGSLVGVSITINNEKINSYMLVSQCKHDFTENHHTMDLTLRGNLYV